MEAAALEEQQKYSLDMARASDSPRLTQIKNLFWFLLFLSLPRILCLDKGTLRIQAARVANRIGSENIFRNVSFGNFKHFIY